MCAVNVLHVIDHFGLGGAQTLLLDLLKDWDNEKYRVYVCALKAPGVLDKQAKAQGLTISYFDRRKYDPRKILDLTKFIRKNKIQIVHTHLLGASIVGRIAATICRVPIVIVHDHSGFPMLSNIPSVYSRLLRMMDKPLTYVTDRVIAVSYSVKELRVKRGLPDKNKVIVIHNGIDINKFNGNLYDREKARGSLSIGVADVVVGVVGRLSPEKGLECFLEAAAKVSRKCTESKFIIVGDGPCKTILEEKAREWGISDKVIFTGFSGDVPQLLSAMDVFVSSSLFEPFGIAILEAMSMSKPVVATNVGGIPEMIISDVTGILVPPNDAEALYTAIIQLLNDPDKRNMFGQNGRKRIEEYFATQVLVNKLVKLYDELVACKLNKTNIE